MDSRGLRPRRCCGRHCSVPDEPTRRIAGEMAQILVAEHGPWVSCAWRAPRITELCFAFAQGARVRLTSVSEGDDRNDDTIDDVAYPAGTTRSRGMSARFCWVRAGISAQADPPDRAVR